MVRVLVHPGPHNHPPFRHRLSLAQAVFSFVKRLSSLRAGIRPLLCHPIANGLLLPILIYGVDLFTLNSSALKGMNGFWHRVQRWTTNKFCSTPTSILFREACLPPIVSVRYGADGAPKPPGPRPNSPPRPTQRPGVGTFFFITRPWTRQGPRPIQGPEGPPLG